MTRSGRLDQLAQLANELAAAAGCGQSSDQIAASQDCGASSCTKVSAVEEVGVLIRDRDLSQSVARFLVRDRDLYHGVRFIIPRFDKAVLRFCHHH